jgi:hypothetical protein
MRTDRIRLLVERVWHSTGDPRSEEGGDGESGCGGVSGGVYSFMASSGCSSCQIGDCSLHSPSLPLLYSMHHMPMTMLDRPPSKQVYLPRLMPIPCLLSRGQSQPVFVRTPPPHGA